MSDYSSVFGLPRRLQLDQEELRQRFYALSRQHHPDFHQLAGERERAEALASSALTNRAYRALRDPVGRVEYLVALEDGRDGSPALATRSASRRQDRSPERRRRV